MLTQPRTHCSSHSSIEPSWMYSMTAPFTMHFTTFVAASRVQLAWSHAIVDSIPQHALPPTSPAAQMITTHAERNPHARLQLQHTVPPRPSQQMRAPTPDNFSLAPLQSCVSHTLDPSRYSAPRMPPTDSVCVCVCVLACGQTVENMKWKSINKSGRKTKQSLQLYQVCAKIQSTIALAS